MENSAGFPPQVFLLPSPGVGHITPMLELGRRLVSFHGLRVTVCLLSGDASGDILLPTLPPLPDGLRLLDLQPDMHAEPIPDDTPVEPRITRTVAAFVPSLRQALHVASPRPAALVVDLFGMDSFDVARDLSLPVYVFFTTSMTLLALMLHSPALDREMTGQFADLPRPIHLSGCITIRPTDVADPMLDRTSQSYSWYLQQCSRLPLADGILINTVEEIDRRQIAATLDDPAMAGLAIPPLYPVGPVIKSAQSTDRRCEQHECLAWLDLQPPGSVLFVSFGSGGTFSSQQTAEIAWGLELSGQRFLWVIRPPDDSGNSAATFFGTSSDPDDPTSYLPEGFPKRTKEKGFLLTRWAPQVEILRHPAVGGFLTHCGWNSVLESLSCGVAMIVWPLYAEQRMNASRLEEELGLAVRVRTTNTESGQLVTREEVARVARLLMEEDSEEGKALKAKAAELQECFAMAVAPGGSSHRSMAAVAGLWTGRGGRGKLTKMTLSSPYLRPIIMENS